jgi:hypothetical protein
MCLSSAGSALRRSVPDGAVKRRTGDPWTVIVCEPDGVFRVVAMFEFDMTVCGRGRQRSPLRRYERMWRGWVLQGGSELRARETGGSWATVTGDVPTFGDCELRQSSGMFMYVFVVAP